MTTANARALRRNRTPAELALWQHLKSRQTKGFKFRRQAPTGEYIADFVCFEAKLVIEVDGGQHAEQIEYDDARTIRLESQGFAVMRLWNNEVLQNLEGVQAVIDAALVSTPHLNPPPQGERKMLGRTK